MKQFLFNLLWGLSLITDVFDFAEWQVGVKGKLCSEWAVNCFDFMVSLLRFALNVLRDDLKMYETGRTGSCCFGEKLEKSTAIQVNLNHLFALFPCSHHPPRARSTFAQQYGSESGDQGQFVHGWKENRGAEVQGRLRQLILMWQQMQVRRRKNASETESDGRIPPLREYVSPGRRSRSVSAHCFSCNSFRAGDHIYRYRHQVLRG
ncbi:hypothetical protein Enr10x_30070 [Gimesia panareensis]|uniref:Uncharacterized protein n=1 Tax=Gimesia panareensis TaxID=2527978 RepID=A0A517Q7S4_9PLAN|nr:hypothetical protein [Gimesia panareensis]QDT27689.1 hypothetical protein Enr10x_30070 [Gimesia panareensis]